MYQKVALWDCRMMTNRGASFSSLQKIHGQHLLLEGKKKKKKKRLELGFIFRTYLCALRVDLKFS